MFQKDQIEKQIEVENEKGRLRRPLIVVKDGQPQITSHHITQLENSELTSS